MHALFVGPDDMLGQAEMRDLPKHIKLEIIINLVSQVSADPREALNIVNVTRLALQNLIPEMREVQEKIAAQPKGAITPELDLELKAIYQRFGEDASAYANEAQTSMHQEAVGVSKDAKAVGSSAPLSEDDAKKMATMLRNSKVGNA